MADKKKEQKRQNKKKQHYVPRTYLSQFTHDGERLFVYDKFTDEIRPSNKMDIAHENYFYDLPQVVLSEELKAEGIHHQIVEDALAELDGKFSRAIEEIITTPSNKNLRHDLIHEMAYLLTVQLLRTRDMRNQVIEAQRAVMQASLDTEIKLNFPDLPAENYPKVETKASHEGLVHAEVIFNTDFTMKMAQGFAKQIWLVGINNTKSPLWTSDSPIVKYHHIRKQSIPGFSGWQLPGVEIAFPLTPKHILLIAERSHFKFLESLDCGHSTLNDEAVTFYNSLQVIQSYRQVYSNNDQFELAKRICTDNPDLRKPRNKVAVGVSDLMKTDNPNELRQIIHIHQADS